MNDDSNFMKIRPVGTELSHADRITDGRTDMTKLIVSFRSFANAPKMIIMCDIRLSHNDHYVRHPVVT
jgi:hypothetical protein